MTESEAIIKPSATPVAGEMDELDRGTFSAVPIPSAGYLPTFHNNTPLSPMVCDQRHLQRLLVLLMQRAGVTTAELARRMDVTPNNIGQYLVGRRQKPSLIWFLKFAELCGARVLIEFPPKAR